MKRLDRRDVDYKELFIVNYDSDAGSCDAVALSDSGELLFVETEDCIVGNDYKTTQLLFHLDKVEYRYHFENAMNNGSVHRAVQKGWTTLDELRALLI